MIGRLATQKERKLNSLLFRPHAESRCAALLLSTPVCRTEISIVRTVLLGGGLENLHSEWVQRVSIRQVELLQESGISRIVMQALQ